MVRIEEWPAERLSLLRPCWERLVADAGLDPLFSSWSWLQNWQRAFVPAHGLQLHSLVALDDQDTIIGMMLLTLRRLRLRGVVPVRRLQLIGNLWYGPATMRTEYSDVPVQGRFRTAVCLAFADFLESWSQWDDLVFQDCPDHSESVNLIVERLSKHALVRDVGLAASDDAVVVETSQPFDKYLSNLGYSTRRRLYLRRGYLGSLGAVTLEYAAESTVEEFFRTLNDLHEVRWGAPVFTGSRLDFHLRVATEAASAGDLFLSRLLVSGKPVSALYNIRCKDREYNIQMGFDDQLHSTKISLGMLHLGYALERAFKDPTVRQFDLLAGKGMREGYKQHLSASTVRLRSLQVIRSPLMRLAYGGQKKVRNRGRRALEGASYTAVVTAAHTITGYATARSLRSEPAKLIGIGRAGRGIPQSSLWSEFLGIDYTRDALLAELERAARTAAGPVVLVPADDFTVELVVREFKRLSEVYRMVFPAPDSAERLLDKGRFYRWAAANGFPVPRTRYAYRADDLVKAIEGLDGAMVVKPIVRTPAYDAAFPRDKAFQLAQGEGLPVSPAELFSLSPGYVVQEWIEGEDSDILFCLVCFDSSGNLVARCTGRKLVQWPEHTGSTALCVTEHDPEVAQLATEVLRCAGLRGLGSLEVKRQRSDGRLYIIEPTVGRNDHQSGVGLAAGVNMTAAYCQAALGKEPDRMYPSRSARWIDEVAFARWARRHGLRKSLRIAGAGRLGIRGRLYLASAAAWDFRPAFELFRIARARMFRA